MPDVARLTSILEDTMPGDAGTGPPSSDESVTVTVPTTGSEPADPDALRLAVELAERANQLTDGGARFQLEGTSEVIEVSEASLRHFRHA